jgi:hypothetical protein
VIWAGSPFAQRIEFSTGAPTGAVSYQLLGNNGAVLVNTSVTPPAGAISHLLIIAASHNTCSKPLFENRTLTWSYTTADGLVSDRVTYRVQRPIPFAVSAEGVRLKLGIEAHELKDEEIDLVTAYAELTAMSPTGALVVHETAGDRNTILCIHAIEAIAALSVLPTMQLRIAQSETSGTNEYKRFGSVDWSRIEAELLAHVARARAALDSSYDATGGSVFTFGVAPRTPDAITGA